MLGFVLGFWVHGLGSWVWGLGFLFRVLSWVLDEGVGIRILGFGVFLRLWFVLVFVLG